MPLMHSRPYLKPVAYASDGVDILVAAFPLQGRSQPPNVHVYGARRPYHRVAPHLFGQIFPTLQLARLRGQRCKQFELLEPQRKRLSPHPCGEVLRIESQLTGLDDPVSRTPGERAPLEVGVDSCCKLLCAKWLRYVVVSTGLEALDLIFLSVFCGNHDNHDVGVISPYLLANLNPVVLAGKHKVEQDEVRTVFSG